MRIIEVPNAKEFWDVKPGNKLFLINKQREVVEVHYVYIISEDKRVQKIVVD